MQRSLNCDPAMLIIKRLAQRCKCHESRSPSAPINAVNETNLKDAADASSLLRGAGEDDYVCQKRICRFVCSDQARCDDKEKYA